MSLSPLVSVILPCYNRARYVRAAVDSALAQSYSRVEVIAVDDGSTDETLSHLRSYGSRIQTISQVDAGVAAARNAGIAAAQGEWIALLDSDDVWMPEKLSVQMELAARFPDSVLLHTLCAVIDSEGETVSVPTIVPDRLENDPLLHLMGHCEPTTSSVIIRKAELDVAGGFDVAFERLGGFVAAEDWELYLRLAERGPFVRVGRPLTCYRAHAQSKSLADKLPHTRGLVALREQIDARRHHWLSQSDTPERRAAFAEHDRAFAHVLGRLGLIYGTRGEYAAAQDAFREAVRREPRRLKHRLRLWRAALHLLSSVPSKRRTA